MHRAGDWSRYWWPGSKWRLHKKGKTEYAYLPAHSYPYPVFLTLSFFCSHWINRTSSLPMMTWLQVATKLIYEPCKPHPNGVLWKVWCPHYPDMRFGLEIRGETGSLLLLFLFFIQHWAHQQSSSLLLALLCPLGHQSIPFGCSRTRDWCLLPAPISIFLGLLNGDGLLFGFYKLEI